MCLINITTSMATVCCRVGKHLGMCSVNCPDVTLMFVAVRDHFKYLKRSIIDSVALEAYASFAREHSDYFEN